MVDMHHAAYEEIRSRGLKPKTIAALIPCNSTELRQVLRGKFEGKRIRARVAQILDMPEAELFDPNRRVPHQHSMKIHLRFARSSRRLLKKGLVLKREEQGYVILDGNSGEPRSGFMSIEQVESWVTQGLS